MHQLGTVGTSPKAEQAGVLGIGNLMTGTSLAPISSSIAPVAGPSSVNGQGQGPRDIPNEKMGFAGEDMRALRQLDRVFTA